MSAAMSDAADDCIEIYESRTRLSFFLGGGILLTLGGFIMTGASIGLLLGFVSPPLTTVRQHVSTILALPIGIVGMLMFGWATCRAAEGLFGWRRPVLFLNRDGFKDIRLSSEWIPWSMVLSVEDHRGKALFLDV